MEQFILYVFIFNIVLTICDASLGYHLAPLLSRKAADQDEEAEGSTRGMRKLLPWVVALYAFLNCLAYFRGSEIFLLIVTFIILLDMTGQFVLMNRMRKKLSD